MSRLFVFTLLLITACQSSPVPAAALPAATPAPALTVRPRAPLRVSWQEVRRIDTQVELIAHVQRLARLPFELEVSIALPPGVTLLSGRTQFTLPPNTESVSHEERLTLGYLKTPTTDLQITASGKSADLGVHAKVPYRFGRAEPLQDAVAPAGPDLKVGQQNFGPSIPISPRQAP